MASIDKMLFHEVSIVDYDRDCANEFGRVRIEMRKQGIEAPPVDLLIASVALVYDLTLATHNTVHFKTSLACGSMIGWRREKGRRAGL
jgi:predicted nucleic acid-binding protein